MLFLVHALDSESIDDMFYSKNDLIVNFYFLVENWIYLFSSFEESKV